MAPSPNIQQQKYDWVMRSLHWIIAIAIIYQLGLGYYSEDLPRGLEKFQLLNRHKALGFTLLLLMFFRLTWRLFKHNITFPTLGSLWQQRLAKINHGLLYVSVFGLATSGWLMASLGNFPIKFWGLFVVPQLTSPSKESVETVAEIHEIFATILGLCIILHVMAVIYHSAVKKNGVLRRML